MRDMTSVELGEIVASPSNGVATDPTGPSAKPEPVLRMRVKVCREPLEKGAAGSRSVGP